MTAREAIATWLAQRLPPPTARQARHAHLCAVLRVCERSTQPDGHSPAQWDAMRQQAYADEDNRRDQHRISGN